MAAISTRMTLHWLSRARKTVSEVSTRRRWLTTCGLFAVDHVAFHHPDLNPFWQLLSRCEGCGQTLIPVSSHRTKNAAMKAAERRRKAS